MRRAIGAPLNLGCMFAIVLCYTKYTNLTLQSKSGERLGDPSHRFGEHLLERRGDRSRKYVPATDQPVPPLAPPALPPRFILELRPLSRVHRSPVRSILTTRNVNFIRSTRVFRCRTSSAGLAAFQLGADGVWLRNRAFQPVSLSAAYRAQELDTPILFAPRRRPVDFARLRRRGRCEHGVPPFRSRVAPAGRAGRFVGAVGLDHQRDRGHDRNCARRLSSVDWNLGACLSNPA